jgi:hypothetical protein
VNRSIFPRRSTLRPDLIAAEISSKTVVDVNSDSVVSLQDLPAAFEMSDKWVELEKQAFALMDTASGRKVDQKEKDRKTSYEGSRIKIHVRSVHGIRSAHQGIQRGLFRGTLQ